MFTHKKKYILGIIVLCFFYVSKGVYDFYQSKIERWHEQAKNAFDEVLQQELQRQDAIFKHYGVDLKVDERTRDEIRHAYISSSLNVDSLNVNLLDKEWHELLYKADIPIKTCIRASILNENNRFVAYSKSSFTPLPKDSLFTIYIGDNGMVEVTGFVFYHWWNVLDGRLPILIITLLFGLGISILIGFATSQFFMYWRNKKSKSKANINTDILIVSDEKSVLYQLERNVFFDANLRILKKEDDIEKLTPQQALLLEAFLKAKEHKLTQKEIDVLLWSDGSGTIERLYTAICRLRKSLERISSLRVDCQIDIYQLKKCDTREIETVKL